MGLPIMRSFSSYEGYERKNDIEPNPNNFEIVNIFEVNNHLVATVLYPNCTNFEGRKVLVFRDMKKNELINVKVLDPHFSNKGISPFARFEPTADGIFAARKLCEIL